MHVCIFIYQDIHICIDIYIYINKYIYIYILCMHVDALLAKHWMKLGQSAPSILIVVRLTE